MADPIPFVSPAATGASEAPRLPFVAVTKALGDPLRWALLREMASGEPAMVVELARRVRKPASLVSKHLAVLRKAGLVDIKQRLHFIPRPLIADPDRRVLDLGYCLLRLETMPDT